MKGVGRKWQALSLSEHRLGMIWEDLPQVKPGQIEPRRI